jgi:radical SAM protein with 4Fe4S-binding SPASM domain
VALWATLYLYKDNFHLAREMVSFFKNMGLDYLVVQEATYCEHSPGGKADYASDLFSPEEQREMREQLLALTDEDCRVKVRFPLNDDTFFTGLTSKTWIDDYCQGIKFYTVISCDGEVYPCWRGWGDRDLSYGSLYERTFGEIWRGERRKRTEEHILKTPPSGTECLICNLPKLNQQLHLYRKANSKWKDFLI